MIQIHDRAHASNLTTYRLPPPAQPSLASARDFLWTGPAELIEPQLGIRILAGGAWRYVEQELNRLLALGPGWNGYRSRRVTREAAVASFSVLVNLIDEQSLPPQFFPLPDGGVQLVWRVAGDTLEVQFNALGEGDAIGEWANGEAFVDGEPNSANLRQMRAAVDKMSWRVMSGR